MLLSALHNAPHTAVPAPGSFRPNLAQFYSVPDLNLNLGYFDHEARPFAPYIDTTTSSRARTDESYQGVYASDGIDSEWYQLESHLKPASELSHPLFKNPWIAIWPRDTATRGLLGIFPDS